MDDIVAILQSRIDAASAASAAKAAWQDGVEVERATTAETKEFVDAFRQAMSIQFGSVDVLSDFGILPRKPRKALSGPEQVAKADKARATRRARHTMGKKQKLSIKGEVPQAAPANESTATPPAVSNGSTAPG